MAASVSNAHGRRVYDGEATATAGSMSFLGRSASTSTSAAAEKIMRAVDLTQLNVTRRLTPVQMFCAQSYWERDERRIEQFVSSLNSAEILQLLKEDVQSQIIPYKALQARALGLISDAQFASLCLLYEAVDQFILHPMTSIVSYILNPDGTQTITEQTVACDMKQKAYRTYCLNDGDSSKQAEIKRSLTTYFSFTEEQYGKFVDAMKAAPFSEQLFFSFNVPLGGAASWSPMYEQVMHLCGSFRLVDVDPPSSASRTRFGSSFQQMIIVPSFTMLQTFLRIIYPESAVTLVPMLGKCSTRTIQKNVLEGKRVINIGMPAAQLDTVVHSMYAGQLGATFHDIYHAERYSRIKPNEQAALRRINQIFTAAIRHDPENKELRHAQWTLIDGELHNSVVKKEKFGELFAVKSDWKDEHTRLIIRDMVTEKELWMQQFQLSVDDLLQGKQRVMYYEIEELLRVQASAARGDAHGEYRLGIMYRDGKGITKSDEQAVAWLQKAAEHGMYLAPYELFKAYQEGRGVLRSEEAARVWLDKAATQDYRASYTLGEMYARGIGVERSLMTAIQWFEKSQGQSYGPQDNPYDARLALKPLYQEAAKGGNAHAQYKLGCEYWSCGIAREMLKIPDAESFKMAALWLQKAADQGHGKAQFELGCMHETGQGFAPCNKTAAEWYQKAADQGVKPAQEKLKGMRAAGAGTHSS